MTIDKKEVGRETINGNSMAEKRVFSGRKLKALRLRRGWEVKQLAEIASVYSKGPIDPVSIYGWEGGKNQPLADTVYPLARALGVAEKPFEELYEEIPVAVDVSRPQ